MISFGLDVNGSGILESSEVSSTTTICNGAGGGDSCAPVIKVTPVSPGALCTTGGVLIEYGTDSGELGAGGAGGAGGSGSTPEACDGLLDPGEESMSEVVCNGPAGADGTDGMNGTDGTDGENGIDGANGNDGVNGVDGADGTNMAVRLSFVAAGNANCVNGGMLLESGVDDNDDGVLDTAEVENQAYSCF